MENMKLKDGCIWIEVAPPHEALFGRLELEQIRARVRRNLPGKAS